jgi:hypothetical protein
VTAKIQKLKLKLSIQNNLFLMGERAGANRESISIFQGYRKKKHIHNGDTWTPLKNVNQKISLLIPLSVHNKTTSFVIHII